MTEAKKFNFKFPNITGVQTSIPLETGSIIFVLGANGGGKSGLMLQLSNQNPRDSKRISAHRQTWFTSNALGFTPADKVQTEKSITQYDTISKSRYSDSHHNQRSQVTIYNLINSQNERARKIAEACDSGDMELAKKLSKKKAPLALLNSLLKLSNLPLEISVQEDERVFASKNGGEPYSIAELSDGERNAILIAADVLTAKPETLFIIDEPERHLHRSIISPLLTSLFIKRPDCAFVIATHDISLPLDNPDGSVLVVRECKWTANNIVGWDADLISSADNIDYQTKQDILGARRTLLFVEGEESSLDQHIYNIIFPEATVMPQGSCKEVERAVRGIASTKSLHWANALGIVDADDRTDDEINNLKQDNIYAVPCYSVEALYYTPYILEKIAMRSAEFTGGDASEYIENAHSAAFKELEENKQRLCARLCERKIKTQIKAPNWKDIQAGAEFKIEVDTKTELEHETQKFDDFVKANNLQALIERYPIRQTGALTAIVKALELNSRTQYENAVRKLLAEDEDSKIYLRGMFDDLVEALSPEQPKPAEERATEKEATAA